MNELDERKAAEIVIRWMKFSISSRQIYIYTYYARCNVNADLIWEMLKVELNRTNNEYK